MYQGLWGIELSMRGRHHIKGGATQKRSPKTEFFLVFGRKLQVSGANIAFLVKNGLFRRKINKFLRQKLHFLNFWRVCAQWEIFLSFWHVYKFSGANYKFLAQIMLFLVKNGLFRRKNYKFCAKNYIF